MPRRPTRPPQTLRLKASSRVRTSCSFAFTGLPKLIGSPIHVSLKPELTSYRGKLLSHCLDKGVAVHAASFIRTRKIVLESELVANPRLLRQILLHELFHFVWLRLGNPCRDSFASLLLRERESRAVGEIGESSQVRKELLRASGSTHDRPWRDYICESFCDTAAWIWCSSPRDKHCTLAKRYRDKRKVWFQTLLKNEIDC